MSREELVRARNGAFRRFYFRPPIARALLRQVHTPSQWRAVASRAWRYLR